MLYVRQQPSTLLGEKSGEVLKMSAKKSIFPQRYKISESSHSKYTTTFAFIAPQNKADLDGAKKEEAEVKP